ncbi:hypothetical protein [Rhizobium sp. NFR03]|uniref:DUF6894 family protein n=1 Tax=Rhizobium sp. NFR03 TaxID=1566263 RepID=UPI0008D355BC|nr:hypothetical protein [Rhizobium sp. NFR03]SES42692.1 hypothetical protein SAMN03159406_04306 [Rhizobium sp. NFR03]
MTRYYFHTRTGDEFREDAEGIELPTLDAAMTKAVGDAYSLIASCVQQRKDIRPQLIEVTAKEGGDRGIVNLHQLVFDLLKT